MVVLSLGVSCYLVVVDRTQAFYSPLSRAWELLAGAVLAMPGTVGYLQPKVARYRWLPGAAAMLVIGADLTFQPRWAFPGLLVLVPVAAAFLLFLPPSSAPFNKGVMGHPWMVAVGRISYPLYLWHWPLISLATIMGSGRPGIAVRLGLILASFALATLTYLCVERPSKQIRDRYLIPLLLLCMLITGFLGANIYQRDGLDRVRHKK
jgi:peptidoglycan/LPS O-acetylase OafA/YrhL